MGFCVSQLSRLKLYLHHVYTYSNEYMTSSSKTSNGLQVKENQMPGIKNKSTSTVVEMCRISNRKPR